MQNGLDYGHGSNLLLLDDFRSALSQSTDDPLIIMSNNDFILAGLNGSGTVEEPYLIHSLYIITANTYGILIYETNVYYEIWNCTIISTWYLGIRIDSSMDANISQCTIVGAETCLQIKGSPSANIENVTFKPALYGTGIYLEGVPRCSLSNSSIVGGEIGLESYNSQLILRNNYFQCSRYGVFADFTPFSLFSSNTFINCTTRGLRLDFSDNSTIINNFFTNGGLSTRYSDYLTIEWNNFTNCGMYFSGPSYPHYDHVLVSNFIDEKPILFLKEDNSGFYKPDDFAQIYLIGCDSTTIQNGNLTSSDVGLMIVFSTSCIVENVSITTPHTGIVVDNSWFTSITNCTISNCFNGLYLREDARNSLIIDNMFSFNRRAIIVQYQAPNNLFVNNTFYSNDFIGVDDGSDSMWDDGSAFGNIYDDYIGDGFYSIPGWAQSIDHFPRRYGPYPTTTDTTPVGLIFPVMIGIAAVCVGILLILIRKPRRE
ncbi:MAG: right-handed parallel beta-helix repeat-containing protein [Candidatus Thorarchaeota archaeon]